MTVVGNNLLVGNTVFSEMALRIFLIFCMKLGDYKGRKVTEPDFWKKFLIWRYSRKRLQISPKSDILIFFSKTAQTIFLVFGLKLVINITFNLNETYFSEKIAIWRFLTSKSSKNCPNWGFWPFSRLCIISFPCLCVFIQFDGPVNVFLFSFLHQFIDLKKKTRWQLIQSTNTNYKLCES